MVDNKCGTATEELKLWIIEFDIPISNNNINKRKTPRREKKW